MQSKTLSLFTPSLANVSFTLPETCALKSFENESIKRKYERKGKTEYDI